MDFMKDIQPDDSTRNYLLTVLSLCLTTDTSIQSFWLLTGSGANGKTKLMNFLWEALGDHYGTAPTSLLTRKREDANQTNEALCQLEKARVAVFSEASAGDILHADTVKQLTGEEFITTRGLNEKQRRWKPMFKPFLVCNQPPRMSESTWAIWRRVKSIDFPTVFVENPKRPNERKKDTQIGDKLSLRVKTFVAILVEYYRRYRLEGLVEPDEVRAATLKYQTDNDVFEEFSGEFIVEEQGSALSLVELRREFRAWANARKYNIPSKDQQLEELFAKKLGEVYRNNWRTMGWLVGWKDMRLLPSVRRLRNISRGEQACLQAFSSNHLVSSIEREVSYPQCTHKKPLRFDFRVTLRTGTVLLTEFQGIQHYQRCVWDRKDDDLENRQIRDQIKVDFCGRERIPLLVIPYWDIDKVPRIINTFINQR